MGFHEEMIEYDPKWGKEIEGKIKAGLWEAFVAGYSVAAADYLVGKAFPFNIKDQTFADSLREKFDEWCRENNRNTRMGDTDLKDYG